MLPDSKGICVDERNTAYGGAGLSWFFSLSIINNLSNVFLKKKNILKYHLDADNTCKIPFFLEGVWYENCTLGDR